MATNANADSTEIGNQGGNLWIVYVVVAVICCVLITALIQHCIEHGRQEQHVSDIELQSTRFKSPFSASEVSSEEAQIS